MMNKINTDSNPDSRDDVVTMKGGGSSGGGGNINTQQHETTSSSTWGTWEELLLACAVKRHGFKDWDSVAMEIQAKTSLPHLLTTAYNCKLKYHDLRRRFTSSQNDDVPADHDPIPWLDDLRKLRVAQLRQDLHSYDVSILSLQLKVKRLEEERGESLKDGEDGETKPDLGEDSKGKGHRSENDKKPHHDVSDRSEPDDKPDRPLHQPDHENQSVNGSNSTCSKSQGNNKPGRVVSEPDPVPTGSVEPEKGPGGNSDSESDSDKGSSETVAKKRKGSAAAAASSGEIRESSEAQSSASLTRKRNKKRRRRMDLPSERNEDEVLLKSQPLVAVLQLIRAHEHSSLFERRLASQESERYKSMIQQHVDLETIQTKLNKDSYSSCTLTFYRDLLLLFSNAVVFFPKSSVESITAHQLRRLVLNEMKKNSLITRPDPSVEPSDSLPRPASPSCPSCPTQPPPKRPHELERSDSLLAKHKSTAPIIVCRKRSSISSKPKGTEQQQQQQQQQQKDEKKPAFDLKPPNNVAEEHGGSVLKSAAAKANKESNTVTGTRSSRRTTTTHHEHVTNNGSTSTKKQGSKAASEAQKGDRDKKKTKTTTDGEAAALDKKRSAAADFLKRIKRNSAADTLKNGGGTSTRGGDQQKRRGMSTGKVEHKVKERVLRQTGDRKQVNNKEESSPSKRSVGRPPKKAAAAAAAEANAVSPKRTRESRGKEASRRPRKRSRR